jgi:RimJ/RimL family protein N-acetyltransferase
MSDLPNWTPRPFPERKVLPGRYCRLEPLDVARHGADLWAAMAGANAVWDYLPAPPPKDRAEYEALLDSMVQNKDICPFAVIVAGKAVGHMWMMEIRPAQGVFEVGWITYSPVLQRTPAATEAVYLIGDYRNEPSKRAAVRYGFKYEGLFRQHMVVKGENRDTAWYSILDGEWPARKAAFQRWLSTDNFDAQGKQMVSLSALNAA